jgi:hypothetical protein
MKENNTNLISIQSFRKPAQALAVILSIAVLLTACAPQLAQSSPTPQQVVNDQENTVISAAKSALAKQLQISVDSIQLMDIQQVQWPDGCLGVQQPGIMCAMHVVDGYKVMLSANDQTHEVRSNLDGSQIVVVPEQTSSIAPAISRSGEIQIADFSSSINGVDGNPDQQVISYNMTIYNSSDNTITLLWLKPVLQDSLSGRVTDANLKTEENETIAPNSQLAVHGQIAINTSGLTKQDIAQLGSLFSGFTISTNQTIPLP